MDWFYEWVTSGSDLNVLIQSYRHPMLDTYFRIVTAMGAEEFYLVVMPIFYWLVHKPFGRRLAYLLILSSYLNAFFKNLFALPRPFEVDPRVVRLVETGGYGLPSGHAQLSTAIWGYTAWFWRQRQVWILPAAIVLILSIIFSRLYLGVHYPADSLAGLSLGLLILYLWLRYLPLLTTRLQQIDERLLLWGGILGPVLLLFLMPGDAAGYPAEAAGTNAGIWLGANIGFFFEARRVRFTTPGTWWQYLARYLVGLLLMGLFWAGLRVLFEPVDLGHLVDIILRFVRYALVACAAAWWGPALFVRLGLAKQEPPDVS